MAMKLTPPDLAALDEAVDQPPPSAKPDLRTSVRRAEPLVEDLIRPGFVAEVAPALRPDPDDKPEAITLEFPRRLKRALQAEVARRRDVPELKATASLKSIVLQALASYGYEHLIREQDVEVQTGIFMKRQAVAQRR